MNHPLLEKLETYYIRFKEIGQLITDPEVIQDMERYVRLTKEYKELETITRTADKFKAALLSVEESKDILLHEEDKELREMAEMEIENLDNSDDEAPIIRLLNSLIERAIKTGASDVHIEPFEKETRVRMRIDGLLRRVLTVPSELQSTVISRLKIMGGMNIAEHIAASLTLRGWSPRRSVWS